MERRRKREKERENERIRERKKQTQSETEKERQREGERERERGVGQTKKQMTCCYNKLPFTKTFIAKDLYNCSTTNCRLYHLKKPH